MNEIKNKQVELSHKNNRLGGLIRIYCQPAFLICVILLAVAGGGMTIAIDKLGIVLTKKPIALKKPLESFQGDEPDQIGPYKVISKQEIGKDIIKALGTEDYIQWLLEDTTVPIDSNVRNCSLFITYYGNADRIVTHVPDECYIGGGYERKSMETLSLKVKDPDGPSTRDLKTSYIVFGADESKNILNSGNFAVLYLFYADGVYTGSRTATRLILNKNIFSKHSYYSKIEWKFSSAKYGNSTSQSKEETIAASQKLLGVILPILEKEYWPGQEEESMDVEKQNN